MKRLLPKPGGEAVANENLLPPDCLPVEALPVEYPEGLAVFSQQTEKAFFRFPEPPDDGSLVIRTVSSSKREAFINGIGCKGKIKDLIREFIKNQISSYCFFCV
ncbi:MAG: hypothetical protein IPH16_20555 [Haliscomenobacter sp.]|nr:hypothetical protein [Haliscomenobacter sp.]